MSAQEIRNTWLRFFESKGHLVESSASLIPVGDPTLLWVNAGVTPLKKYFDGTQRPKSPRLTNIQKCIRTNDIDNVGRTARHHTFFEMLGNFSIGDYFKEDAIKWAFELLTDSKWFGFPQEKLYITYYPSDKDAYDIWIACGISKDHLIPIESNFWEIGPGPSGPDTEIFFDRGESYDKRGTELIKEDIENERYIEIWNIVFSQFNADPKRPRSAYKELPHKNIDTGAGLERFACIIQGTKTNFETDLFYPIILKTAELSGVVYQGQMAFKVIADHIKTLTFAISDGAILSNEGRGYVLRRILRRAVKYGRTLGFNQAFLYQLVPQVIEMMQDFYPSLKQTFSIVQKIVLKEEEKFFETIADGEKHLLSVINQGVLSGVDAFKLYDTYGFPIELTLEYAMENEIQVDLDGFNKALNEQKERSRQARQVDQSMKAQTADFLSFKTPSQFVGYDVLEIEAKVIKVFEQGIVLDYTPFYATMGGQTSDTGTINGLFVTDVIKLPHGQYLHHVETDSFNEGDEVLAIVDEKRRLRINQNHTATHLLHQALKDILGTHIKQQGSFVGAEKLTFDFNHFESVTPAMILNVEAIVKQKIKANLPVLTHILPIEEAKKLGANMLFGEKYGDVVRVVDIGKYSLEFCGGTHVSSTKDIGDFMIASVESIGSGIFRIEALTHDLKNQSKDYLSNLLNQINQLIEKRQHFSKDYVPAKQPVVRGSYEDIIDYHEYIEMLKHEVKQAEKTFEQNEVDRIIKQADKWIPEQIHKTTYIVTHDLSNLSLKPLIDVLYDKIKTEVVVLVNIAENKASFLAKTKDKHAGQIIKELAEKTGGKGGGKADFAQGGTQDINALRAWLKEI